MVNEFKQLTERLSHFVDVDPNDLKITVTGNKPPNYMQDISVTHVPTGIAISARGQNKERILQFIGREIVKVFRAKSVELEDDLHIDYTKIRVEDRL
jgi:hypothetical protein